METDVLFRKTQSRETQRDPIPSGILECIRKNAWNNFTIAEKPFKEARYKLMVERGIKYNADATVPRPKEKLRKDIIKSVHHDIHGGVAATQSRLRLLAYCKDVEEHIRCPKCMEIRKI